MIIHVSSSFTRPANTTAYAIGDLVANSATAGSVVPLTFSLARLGAQGARLNRVRLYKDDTTTAGANFRLNLFTQSVTVTNGDNGAFAVSSARYLIGRVGLDLTTGALDGATPDLSGWAELDPAFGLDTVSVSNAERRIYGLLEARAAYTPASGETFEVTLELFT